ncbi:MAG TPA: serine protease [Chitinophagales bacterium]|nr:serine protease [Chitinophagales bacterium]
MSKTFVFPIYFLLMMCCVNFAKAQNDYATIHIMSKGMPSRIYMNDELVTGLNKDEALEYKIKSRGRITITGLMSYGRAEGAVEVKDGLDIYIVIYGTSFTNADLKRWEKEKKNFVSTVVLEESSSAPIVKNNKSSGPGQGTCFAISPNGYLITNYHCVENAKEVTVKGIDGDFTTKYGATVVASDPSNDLALLKIGNKNVKFETPMFGLRSSGVNQAEKVYALGFPAATAMGAEVKITEGIISSKSGVQGDVSKFQISAAVNHGNSGGPLIDEQGNLIGVIFAKSTIAESAGYAIKAGYLETFLKNVDGFEYPAFVNTIKDKSLTEKVAGWKSEIFIVESN